MTSANTAKAARPNGRSKKSKYKMAVTFLESTNDNSASTVQGRDLELPPLQYFYCNSLKRCRYLINEYFPQRKKGIIQATVYSLETRNAVLKYSMENGWNNTVH